MVAVASGSTTATAADRAARNCRWACTRWCDYGGQL